MRWIHLRELTTEICKTLNYYFVLCSSMIDWTHAETTPNSLDGMVLINWYVIAYMWRRIVIPSPLIISLKNIKSVVSCTALERGTGLWVLVLWQEEAISTGIKKQENIPIAFQSESFQCMRNVWGKHEASWHPAMPIVQDHTTSTL